MSQTKQSHSDGEERHSALLNNAGAVRAICSAVEGTLGPKGLDTMLVGGQGEVLITNDGATILEQMDVSHPAARLMVQVARSQQQLVGDGTTTATVLAGAMVAEGVAEVLRGVPVAKVVAGMQEGVRLAVHYLRDRSREVSGTDDPILRQIAYVAGREHTDIAQLVIDAAQLVGADKLRSDAYRLAEAVVPSPTERSEVWPGILINRQPAILPWLTDSPAERILVLQDAFEPETTDEEALNTESGFKEYMQRRERFRSQLEQIAELGIGIIAIDRGADPEAEQYCADRGIFLLTRVSRRDLRQLCLFTGARPIRRSALNKTGQELSVFLGRAGHIGYDERLEKVKIAEGGGSPFVSILVGASTEEVGGEHSRIAMDAAAAVQAAIRGGYVPGGGAMEVAAAREIERYRETVHGMEAFGLSAAARALRKPLAQMVVNAGFNPLEKVELVKASQLETSSDSIGIDCDTGELIDSLQAQIVDPALVKIHAIQAAGEVASAVLKIHTVVKMKKG
ncbi:TCP-1/cpn60 chaperonin family protein [Paenibacillus sp. J2TS4]|uniref:TCP-1/cpn60 chaperonin family protein n=1 Tax=Paenibacillus sp. J2TS4 TaxID=2807194 RepID=UPI001B10051D|nr:TCP-1/cpn60 chaperonin family protein [Paenibacillus sp. J2TS4]GIP35857.1 thermosome-like protein [Paenibacillus sp. J2TS4]